MKKKREVPKLCLVSSSGGHWEQLQKLQPLIDKYDGFLVTEKTQFEAINGLFNVGENDTFTEVEQDL